MKNILNSILAVWVGLGLAVPGSWAAEAKELSLDDLGFQADQMKSDPAMQARLHKRSRMLKTHQILGLVTAVPILATVMTAPEFEGGNPADVESETDTHKMLGIASGAMFGPNQKVRLQLIEIEPGMKALAGAVHRAVTQENTI